MKLGELLRGLDVGALTEREASVRICDITEDSRTVVPGSLFIARAGHKADGKRFVDDALSAGACAVLTDDAGLAARLESKGGVAVPVVHATDITLVSAMAAERFYGGASSRLKLAGVTGTNGKTTTTYLIWQLMNSAKKRCGLIGTVVIDDGSEVAPANMTTPPAVELSRTFGVMHEAGCTAAALEVSSHALDQKRVDALRFEVAVFSNLTGDHLDYHGTMEKYASAKARLFEMISPEGTAIVNADDPAHARMLKDCKGRVLRCHEVREGESRSSSPGTCTVRMDRATMDGMELMLAGPWGEIAATVPLVGRYNAMNVLQSVASAHAMGVSSAELSRALPQLQAPPGRLERVSGPADAARVFVDYAHSDDSLRNVLSAVGEVMPGRMHGGARMHATAGAAAGSDKPGRLWVVFGCGGDRDKTKRPRMGLAAAELADKVIVTSDNPRTERPGDIIDQVLAGIPSAHRHKVDVHADRAKAIRLAVEQALPGDMVVIAGKGHETEQILPDGAGGTIKTHFDDREVAGAALAERRCASMVEGKPEQDSGKRGGR